ncbi:MAG: flagellar basal body-associated FliL family protein [Alphaproteobacteria bacterium]|nr:flagellar basal body-associated FliL family protein [Alphaproteobacteria bacterium]
MSTAVALEEATPAGEGAAKGGRKKLLVIALPVLLVLVAGGLWFSGVLPRMLGLAHEQPHGAQHENAPPAAPIYVEVPELVANLNGNPRRPAYIKVKPRLEVAKQEDVARVQTAMPRLLDMFQTFLRETRPEELRGSAGIHRLREELISRANIAVPGGGVTDVLFTEMLIQ